LIADEDPVEQSDDALACERLTAHPGRDAKELVREFAVSRRRAILAAAVGGDDILRVARIDPGGEVISLVLVAQQ
jgi:hypothetical protein